MTRISGPYGPTSLQVLPSRKCTEIELILQRIFENVAICSIAIKKYFKRIAMSE
jgi:hypothetical protein